MTRRPLSVRRNLAGAIRQAARLHCEELIAELYPQLEVQRRLVKRYKCTVNVAGDLYREAMAELRKVDEEDRPERIARMQAQIGRLYRTAFKKERYSVCRQLLTDLRRMGGIEGALKLDLPLLGAGGDFGEDRSDEDLEYYNEHGHWPEEAPRAGMKKDPGAVAQKPTLNPLDKLH